MEEDLLVPVRRCPSDAHYSLIPSNECFLSPWKSLELFLSIPLVPHFLAKENFFQILKARRWLNLIDEETLKQQIQRTIFMEKEFVALLRWLAKNEINNRTLVTELLSVLKYRSSSTPSTVVELRALRFYPRSPFLSVPLPRSVLPGDVVQHLTLDDLEEGLKFTAISMKDLAQFYLQEEQKTLFADPKVSPLLLHFFSQHWNQFNANEKQAIGQFLSSTISIPTTAGMKLPSHSYLPSLTQEENLPLIELHIPQLSLEKTNSKEEFIENSVSLEFLQSIGCRTIHIPSEKEPTATSSLQSNSTQSLQFFIQDLLKRRKYLSETDLQALKRTPSLQGKILLSIFSIALMFPRQFFSARIFLGERLKGLVASEKKRSFCDSFSSFDSFTSDRLN